MSRLRNGQNLVNLELDFRWEQFIAYVMFEGGYFLWLGTEGSLKKERCNTWRVDDFTNLKNILDIVLNLGMGV